jgi:hypothetical protein
MIHSWAAEPALMDPSTELVITRRVEGASAMRSMLIGAVGMLMGGAFVLCAVFDLAVGLRGRIESGPQEAVGVVLALAIAALGTVSFVRGLVVREESTPGTDLVSVTLVTLVTVPLAVLAFGGYLHANPPDKHLQSRGLPYAFTYPGQWEPDPPEDLPEPQNAAYIAGVSKQVEGTVTQGVLVQVFGYEHPERLDDSVRQQLREQAFTVVAQRRIEVDGRPAFRIEFERPRGTPQGTQVIAVDGDDVYWITCIHKQNVERARAGCDKVIDSFQIIGLTDPARPARNHPA